MRKIRIGLLAMALIPAMAFAQTAQVALGPAVFFKSPILLGQEIDVDALNTNQISLGADLLFRVAWFKAEALALVSLGEVHSVNMFLDAGVSVDVDLVTFSFGIGPNFTGNFNGSRPVQAGLNARFGLDLLMGMNSLGISYITAFNIEDQIVIGTRTGLLGAHLLFWL
jgi:hypothetical protein